MAHTIGTQGPGVLVSLGNLILSYYLGLIIFIVFVFGLIMVITRAPIRQFVRAIREPATIAFATTSSESAMPRAMEAMERLGVPKRIVGFVMPTGYSFNLDGSMIFLAVTSIFIVQAAGPSVGQHFGFAQQLSMMVAFMITSKGIAGVPRASILVLLATLTNLIPAPIATAGVAIVLGVDAIMDMGRSCVNLIGNALATLVIARWEGEFDDNRARVFGTPAEAELDLRSGDVAFAEAAEGGLGRRIVRRRRLLARETAFALADFFQQFNLDLLNLEQPVVLLSQKMIDFLVQVPNLELGFEIDLVIVLRPQSIARFRPVLAHHDDGRLQRSQAGEDEIQ